MLLSAVNIFHEVKISFYLLQILHLLQIIPIIMPHKIPNIFSALGTLSGYFTAFEGFSKCILFGHQGIFTNLFQIGIFDYHRLIETIYSRGIDTSPIARYPISCFGMPVTFLHNRVLQAFGYACCRRSCFFTADSSYSVCNQAKNHKPRYKRRLLCYTPANILYQTFEQDTVPSIVIAL